MVNENILSIMEYPFLKLITNFDHAVKLIFDVIPPSFH
jgi:hypothetical protein